MGDLSFDTAVAGSGGRYQATLSRDWEIWGPNGGYIAAIALRAAGVHSRFARPASIVGHFLGVADFTTVDIEVTPLRAAKRAESLRVSMTQRDEPIFEALVWAIDDLGGLTHDTTEMPETAPPESLPTVAEKLAERGDQPLFRFWDNLEERPLTWIDDWENRESCPPVLESWLRFRPTATFDDLWIDACRYLILSDTFVWPAIFRYYTDELDYIAPSIDIAVGFHRFRPDDEFLLVRAEAPSANAGMIGGSVQVWARDGSLLAHGSSQLLCRPRPPAIP